MSTAEAMHPDELLAQDMARFYGDPLGFVRYAFPWGEPGTPLAEHKGPREWQECFLRDVGAGVLERGFDGIEPVAPILEATASGHGIGKSAEVAWIILWILSTRPHCKGVVTANTSEQLKTKTWAELAKWLNMCITAHWFGINASKGNLNIFALEAPETWRCDALTCREENSESFAGLHAASSTPFYIFDEASAVPDRIWEVAEGGLTDGEPMWFVFGNPTRNTGRFKECFGRFRHRWRTRKIDSRTVKGTNKELIDRWVNDYGEDSDFVRIRVRGEFPRAGSNQFIGSDVVEAAFGKHLPPDAYNHAAKVIGVDVARFGDDQSVILRRQGLIAFAPSKYRGLDTMTLAGLVAQEINQWRPDAVFIDGGAMGPGVIDRLRQMGHQVTEVVFQGKPLDPAHYFNKRAEMWAGVRDWLKAGGAIPDDQELKDDLVGPEYTYDSSGRILLEGKKEMKARGLASPDVGDSLALSFAGPVAPKSEPMGQPPKRPYDPMNFFNNRRKRGA